MSSPTDEEVLAFMERHGLPHSDDPAMRELVRRGGIDKVPPTEEQVRFRFRLAGVSPDARKVELHRATMREDVADAPPAAPTYGDDGAYGNASVFGGRR